MSTRIINKHNFDTISLRCRDCDKTQQQVESGEACQRMKTPRELAEQARQLYDDLSFAWTPDMRKLRAGDREEHERLGVLSSMFGDIFDSLQKRVFEFEYIQKQSNGDFLSCRLELLSSLLSSSPSSGAASAAGTEPEARTSDTAAGDSCC